MATYSERIGHLEKKLRLLEALFSSAKTVAAERPVSKAIEAAKKAEEKPEATK